VRNVVDFGALWTSGLSRMACCTVHRSRPDSVEVGDVIDVTIQKVRSSAGESAWVGHIES